MSIQYWRMQLHPTDSTFSSFYANTSIAKGFIGLGFENKVGDLLELQDIEILGKQKDYLLFATEMKVGDIVLIMSHHNPVAVVKIKSDYNYIRETVPELGIWFRHFRKIEDEIIYYTDFETNKNNFQSITMSGTISPLRDENSQSRKLIQAMIEWEKSNYEQSIF